MLHLNSQKILLNQKLRADLDSKKINTIDDRISYLQELQRKESLFAVQYTTIFKAAFDGSIPGLKYFLERAKNENEKTNTPDKVGLCPIHYVSERGHVEAIELLVQNGHSVNTLGPSGLTPLMYACKGGHALAIRKLCELGANIMAADMAGMTAAHFAATSDHSIALSKLLQISYENKVSSEIRRLEDEEKRKELELIGRSTIQQERSVRGTPSRASSEDDNTKAQSRKSKKHERKTKNSNPSPRNSLKGSLKGSRIAIDSLLPAVTLLPSILAPSSNAGSTANSRRSSNNAGVTPLERRHSQTSEGRRTRRGSMRSSVRTVDESYADIDPDYFLDSMMNLDGSISTDIPIQVIDTPSRNGTRPLHAAASVDARDALAFLIRAGVDIHAVDSVGETALHRAARRNYNVSYQMLIEAGALDSAKNNMRETSAALMRDDTNF